MPDLVVELYESRVGKLTGQGQNFEFVPDPAAVETFGLDSTILSLAIPFAVVPTRSGKGRRQNFFRELLPEGRMLTRMAQEAGLSERDTIGLLRRYGRDVAGALQIWDPEVPGEPKEPRLEPLADGEVAHLLKHVGDYPLGNKPVGGKTSLAGVQDKIVLARTETGWNRVVDGYPSTHILKPESKNHPSSIYDEEYGARLVRAAGLTDFQTWTAEFSGVPALVIERFDRSPDAPGDRIHQEDFSQILGAAGDQKYQRFGGRVSLERVAKTLFTAVGDKSRRRLLTMTTLAVAVGNLDMHTKNISLLHPIDEPAELAPTYDFVPQVHLPNDGEMALAVNQVYRHHVITRADLIAEGQSWGLRDAETVVDSALTSVLETVAIEAPHPRAFPGLRSDIEKFARNLLAGRGAGVG